MLDLLGTISYRVGNTTQEMTNIVTAVILKRMNIDKTFLYKDVMIQNDATLESISYEHYGKTEYWWVIQVVNNIVDPFNGLPMNSDLLVEFTRNRYGDEHGLHWFIDSRTKRIEDDLSTIKWTEDWKNGTLPEYIVPVSHLDFELDQNNIKSRIKVVNPDYISIFEEVFKEVVSD